MNSGLLGFPNILGLLRATAFRATGKAGATAGCALAGATTSGAPTAGGPFDVGDLVVGQDGTLWICTAAGSSQSSPGTFAQVQAGSLAGILGAAGGGTGLAAAPTDGQLLIGQSSDTSFGLATISAGQSITITNGGHSITIAAQPSSPLVLTPNPFAFIENSPTDHGQPVDFITLQSGDVIAVAGL